MKIKLHLLVITKKIQIQKKFKIAKNMKCLVKSCSIGNKGKWLKGVVSHKIPPPNSEELREKWLSQINR